MLCTLIVKSFTYIPPPNYISFEGRASPRQPETHTPFGPELRFQPNKKYVGWVILFSYVWAGVVIRTLNDTQSL
jgi:hypothetical protein